MKVHPLWVGEFEAKDSTSFRGGNPDLTVWYASYIFYIEGAARKIVVDTSFADPKVCLEKMNHQCRRPSGASVEEKLAGLGVKPAERAMASTRAPKRHGSWRRLSHIEWVRAKG